MFRARWTKTYFGGLKAHLRATDHTSSNIISRDIAAYPSFITRIMITRSFTTVDGCDTAKCGRFCTFASPFSMYKVRHLRHEVRNCKIDSLQFKNLTIWDKLTYSILVHKHKMFCLPKRLTILNRVLQQLYTFFLNHWLGGKRLLRQPAEWQSLYTMAKWNIMCFLLPPIGNNSREPANIWLVRNYVNI
jgi:hypothetical protein